MRAAWVVWALTDGTVAPVRTTRPRLRLQRKFNLRQALFALPNALTLAAVFCGFAAVRSIAMDQPSDDVFYGAVVLVFFAMLFDLLDGRIARLTRTQSDFGRELDSLADLVSFGVAPALIAYKWALRELPFPVLGELVAYAFVACGAVRLARFNLLSSEEKGGSPQYMVGLPIPPAAGILLCLVVTGRALAGTLGQQGYAVFLAVATAGLSLLMVSNLQFRSFKDIRANILTFVVVFLSLGSAVLVWIISRPQFALLWLLSWYLMIGIVESVYLLLIRGRTSKS